MHPHLYSPVVIFLVYFLGFPYCFNIFLIFLVFLPLCYIHVILRDYNDVVHLMSWLPCLSYISISCLHFLCFSIPNCFVMLSLFLTLLLNVSSCFLLWVNIVYVVHVCLKMVEFSFVLQKRHLLQFFFLCRLGFVYSLITRGFEATGTSLLSLFTLATVRPQRRLHTFVSFCMSILVYKCAIHSYPFFICLSVVRCHFGSGHLF